MSDPLRPQACPQCGGLYGQHTMACAQKDAEIAALKERCLTKDASIEAFDMRNEQLVERIAALEALLERMTHQIDEHRAGDYPPGHEPCSHDCPACAWERIKKEKP
jgi:hypothetical protein